MSESESFFLLHPRPISIGNPDPDYERFWLSLIFDAEMFCVRCNFARVKK
jgi:hypothetical protein